MRVLPETRSGLFERTGAEIVRSAEMRGKAMQALRYTIHLDRGAAGNEDAGTWRSAGTAGGRARDSAAKQNASESAGAGVHPEARISGRSSGVRGLVERRAEFSQP